MKGRKYPADFKVQDCNVNDQSIIVSRLGSVISEFQSSLTEVSIKQFRFVLHQDVIDILQPIHNLQELRLLEVQIIHQRVFQEPSATNIFQNLKFLHVENCTNLFEQHLYKYFEKIDGPVRKYRVDMSELKLSTVQTPKNVFKARWLLVLRDFNNGISRLPNKRLCSRYRRTYFALPSTSQK